MKRTAAYALRLDRMAFEKDVVVCGVPGVTPRDSLFPVLLGLSILTGREFTETVELTGDALRLRKIAEEQARHELVKFAGVEGEFEFQYEEPGYDLDGCGRLRARMTYEDPHRLLQDDGQVVHG